MKKKSSRRDRREDVDTMRPECNLSKLKGGVRGKYYWQAIAGTNPVLIDPELLDVFPQRRHSEPGAAHCAWQGPHSRVGGD